MSSATPSARGLSIWITALAFISASALAQDRSWIERSDHHTAMVFETLGAFYPEWMSSLGIDKFDTAVMDAGPGLEKRIDAALAAQVKRLAAARQKEGDRRVREDLDIDIDALERMRRTSALEQRLLVPVWELPRQMFEGLQMLLDKRNSDTRRQHALGRLRGYAGMVPGGAPVAKLVRSRTLERANAKRLWPYRGEVEQQLHNCERYIAGIAELFRSSPVQGWEAPHERLAAQLREYCGWVKAEVLPRARATPMLPRELYADRLKNVGVDISPEQAIALGTATFAEVRDQMAMLAAEIARERKFASSDYRQVLRELKREALPTDALLPYYRERLADIERIIERERLLSLPKRAAAIRLASEAESAATPAPYLNVPRLIGNRGEVGEFVIPLTNPNAKSGTPPNDFTAPAAAWALTAHEARPGHELQFASMVEGGVSFARGVFASNSTNTEGWALYAEAIVLPHFPPEGRLFGLQMRLMRAAREFLDPMVNLGRMTPEAAKAFLMREVTLSEALAQQEADRYAFRAPGQAVSYLYGYSRLRELRMKAEIALGDRFDQREFHDLIIAQGLLPPALLERAVLAELTRRYPGTARAAGSGRSAESPPAKGGQAR
jgi:polyhydroxyalkanoate synthesis regulator phasin